MSRAAVLLLAAAIDTVAGQLPSPAHPVAWLGRAIAAAYGRPREDRAADLCRGSLATAGLAVAAIASGIAIERALAGQPGRTVVTAMLVSQLGSFRGLADAAGRVASALDADDLPAARTGLAWLVSRAAGQLDESGIASAAIESVAENLGDSVAGPALAYAVGGLPALLVYRIANTADAMVGYRDGREWLGKAAARWDDVLNLLPARLTAATLCLLAPLAGGTQRHSWQRTRLGAASTASPNAGWPMAAAAGALDVRLEKPGHHRLNPAARPPTAADVRRAVRLGWAAAACVVATSALLSGIERRP